MDCPVSQHPIRIGNLRSAIGGVLLLAAGAAWAQLGDPTQPPAGFGTPLGAATVAPATPATPQLQSILVSREAGGRRVAVINGQTVQQGMKVGGATVLRVGESEVVLQRGKTQETLKLFPKAAEKR